jgi:DNA-binding cell septation regulator SpoVG
MTAAIEVLAIRRLDGKSAVKAFVDLRLGGVTIKGAKIIQQANQQAWLAMPAVKTERAWLNVVELSKELRARATEVALAAWEQAQRTQIIPPAKPRGQQAWDSARAATADPAMTSAQQRQRHVEALAGEFPEDGDQGDPF